MSTVSPTDSLPPEKLLEIFHLLSPQDLKTVVLVSRRWREVGETPILWGWVSLKVNPDNLSSMPEILDTRRLETAMRLTVVCRRVAVPVSDQLLQAVGRHSGLKLLHLVATDLSSVEAGLLASVVARMETVTFCKSNMTSEQLEAIFTAINGGESQSKNLTIVNNVPTVTPEILATAVAKFEEVYIRDTQLTSPQCEALFSAISRGSHLRCLDISDNNLATVTPQLLATVVTKLESVDIHNTRLTSSQCNALFSAISRGSQLKSLAICGNNLDTVTPQLLATVEKQMKTDIRTMKLTDEQTEAIYQNDGNEDGNEDNISLQSEQVQIFW